MILDAFLLFSGSINGATAPAPANGRYTDAPAAGDASNIIDLGVISGIPTSARGGGARDIGVGDHPILWLSAIVTDAIGGTIGLTLSGAPDNGSGAPGAWTPMWSTPALVAAPAVGVQLANVAVPRVAAGQPLPRFLKLTYTGAPAGGSVNAGIVLDRDDQIVGPTGQLSGYVPGITVAN